GKVAAQNILEINDTMSAMHGTFYEYQGIPLMPTYHPSALLRNESMKRPAWEDLKKFKSYLQTQVPEYDTLDFYDKTENIPIPAYLENSIFNQFQKKTQSYTTTRQRL
ncbi:MAG TPA: uracil-DNA glycosylase family protein, partial [Treponemataceae bacterium]|nr:uracil-DNA glycosylase family protein [Treponemataceae bacterium]